MRCTEFMLSGLTILPCTKDTKFDSCLCRRLVIARKTCKFFEKECLISERISNVNPKRVTVNKVTYTVLFRLIPSSLVGFLKTLQCSTFSFIGFRHRICLSCSPEPQVSCINCIKVFLSTRGVVWDTSFIYTRPKSVFDPIFIHSKIDHELNAIIY